jgi:anthranilate synthase component 2
MHEMLRILLIDNYDSFTYNLVQLIAESGIPHYLTIVPNDISIDQLPEITDKVIISPGPGLPEESGNLMQLIAHYATTTDLLGICLGHQALAIHFGATLKQLQHCAHGIGSFVTQIEKDSIFEGVSPSFVSGRYHSWIIDEDNLTPDLVISARDEDGNIMAFYHKSLPIHGLQFHPESFITNEGRQIIRNWLTT